MKTLLPLALLAVLAGCAEEPAETADPIGTDDPAGVVADPTDDATDDAAPMDTEGFIADPDAPVSDPDPDEMPPQ